MLIAYSRHVVVLTRVYFLALLITILSKINMGITKFSYHPPAMVLGAWIFYETAVFKKSGVRIQLYLKNTIHGFIAFVALAVSCFGYWAIYENKELIGKEHFTSYHGQLGVASLAMIFANQMLGASAHYLKISAARKVHRMFSFLILSCFCGALSLGLWSGWAEHNLHWILRYSGTTLATVPLAMWL